MSVTEADPTAHLDQYIEVCERALKAEKASEALLVRWIGVLNGLSKWSEAREKAEVLTTLYATSPSAWLTRIGLLHEQNFAGNYHPAAFTNTIETLFESALEYVAPSDAHALWRAYFEFATATEAPVSKSKLPNIAKKIMVRVASVRFHRSLIHTGR